jgi:hypothetical protein
MENKQTAVEWLIEQIKNGIDPEDGSIEMNWLHNGTIEQALAMQEEQHCDTWIDSRIESVDDNYIEKQKDFEQYYTETYKP